MTSVSICSSIFPPFFNLVWCNESSVSSYNTVQFYWFRDQLAWSQFFPPIVVFISGWDSWTPCTLEMLLALVMVFFINFLCVCVCGLWKSCLCFFRKLATNLLNAWLEFCPHFRANAWCFTTFVERSTWMRRKRDGSVLRYFSSLSVGRNGALNVLVPRGILLDLVSSINSGLHWTSQSWWHGTYMNIYII